MRHSPTLKRLLAVAPLALLTLLAPRQVVAQQRDPLAPLVREAIENNLQLAATRVAERRAAAAERGARGLALPSLSIDSRRSRLDGVIDVGTLVNPAYAALNKLTNSSAFPTDIHQTLPQQAETHLRLAQPLFNPAIGAARQAAAAQRRAQEAVTETATRDIAAAVQLGYLAYASTERVVELDRTVLALTDELLRSSERRLALGLVTPDAVLRARADRAEADQALAEATENRAAAIRSLNLVLGRPIESEPVALLPDSSLSFAMDTTPDAYVRRALAQRDELAQSAWGERAASANVRATRAAFLPSVSVALDYGSQGRELRLGADRDFLVASAVLQWNVFNGGQDVARREQAQLDVERTRVQRADLERQIALQVRGAWGAARVANRAVATATERESAARRNWELVRRRSEQGSAAALDALDARTTWTRAALNLILTRYGYATRWVQLERAAALRSDLAR
ncbi:MAG: TolC family protein [Gemmatimonadaceae bacterium]